MTKEEQALLDRTDSYLKRLDELATEGLALEPSGEVATILKRLQAYFRTGIRPDLKAEYTQDARLLTDEEIADHGPPKFRVGDQVVNEDYVFRQDPGVLYSYEPMIVLSARFNGVWGWQYGIGDGWRRECSLLLWSRKDTAEGNS